MGELNKKSIQNSSNIVTMETKDVGRKQIPCPETVPDNSVGLKTQEATTLEISEMLLANNTTPPTTKPLSTAVSNESHEACTTDRQVGPLGVHLAELSLRLSEIVLRINELENGSSLARQASAPEMKSAIQQVQNINKQLEFLTEGLRNTPDYNIGKTFICSSCGTTGTVAVRVKCTNCKHESWWGRWFQDKQTI
jgi:hypothetical protein